MKEKTDEVRRMFNLPESEVVVQGTFRRTCAFSFPNEGTIRLPLQNVVFLSICAWAYVDNPQLRHIPLWLSFYYGSQFPFPEALCSLEITLF
jgi:hypothetical protein